RDRSMAIEIENRQGIVSLAREKCPMVLRVDRHAVVALTAVNRVTPNHRVSSRIDDGKHILVLQVDVDSSGDRIYCGTPVSLSQRKTFTMVSVVTSMTLTALARSLDTYALRNEAA